MKNPLFTLSFTRLIVEPPPPEAEIPAVPETGEVAATPESIENPEAAPPSEPSVEQSLLFREDINSWSEDRKARSTK